jgi:hypothetical protein
MQQLRLWAVRSLLAADCFSLMLDCLFYLLSHVYPVRPVQYHVSAQYMDVLCGRMSEADSKQ